MSLESWFGWLSGWPLLLLAPLVFLVLTLAERSSHLRLERLLGGRLSRLAAEVCPKRRRLRTTLFSVAILLLVFAMMLPRFGTARQGDARGADLMVCLDVSRSMLARDLVPDRLERAKREVRALLTTLRGDRIGLVAFAGEARLVVPSTGDLRAFDMLLTTTDVLSVARPGTDLGAALTTAGKALQDAGPRVVLLLTDGEDHQREGERAALRLAERGIVVHTIGLGSKSGAKIPVQGEGGETFLVDRDGVEVVSTMDRESLQRLAVVTGGEFVDASLLTAPLVELYERRILPMLEADFAATSGALRPNRFQWPLSLALLCLVVESLLRDRRRR